MQRTFSAPSKLFLSGEYAVLWGGTARVAAVGPRGEATVRSRDDREVHVVLQDGSFSGMTTPDGVLWHRPILTSQKIVAFVVDDSLRALGKECLGFDLTVAPSEKTSKGEKWGLGSSARTAVLCAQACRYVLEGSYDALKVALLAHFEAQGNAGSGADVAASFTGGIIRYRRFDSERLRQGSLRAALKNSRPVELWRIPQCAFPMVYAFSGKSASTPNLIAAVEEAHDFRARDNVVERSDDLGLLLEEGLMNADFSKVAHSVTGLQRLLQGLGPLV